MINGIRLKICGLTSLVDAVAADRAGADYLGFVLYAKSPRHVSLTQYRAMAARLPERKKVAVVVEPSTAELAEIMATGFDLAQVHFRHGISTETIAGWAKITGRERLWLAPKIPPEIAVPPALLPLAQTFLFDAFHAEKFGGSGQTADWTKFRRHREAHLEKTWILSGGLNPDNISVALKATGARFVDVNSGIEASPGVKDQAKLTTLVVQLAGIRIAD